MGVAAIVEYIKTLPGGDWFIARATPLVMSSLLVVATPGLIKEAIKEPSILSSWTSVKDTLFAQQWLIVGDMVDNMYRQHKVELLKNYVQGEIVIDLGTGTGQNLSYLDPSKIGKLICIEPNVGLHEKLRITAEKSGFVEGKNLQICAYGAEDIQRFQNETGLGDNSVDCVISVLALCGIPNSQIVIDSLYKKLKPGHYFVFFEHVLSQDCSTQRYQHLITPFMRFVMGCELNRPTDKYILENFDWQEKKVWGIGESVYESTPKAVGYAKK